MWKILGFWRAIACEEIGAFQTVPWPECFCWRTQHKVIQYQHIHLGGSCSLTNNISEKNKILILCRPSTPELPEAVKFWDFDGLYLASNSSYGLKTPLNQ